MHKLKKTILIIGIILLFYSCDKISFDDYIIQNRCDTTISCDITLWNKTGNSFIFTANVDSLIYNTGGIGDHDPPEKSFNSIVIIKNGHYASKRWRDKNNWHYVDIDATHRKWYLTIYPDDFE